MKVGPESWNPEVMRIYESEDCFWMKLPEELIYEKEFRRPGDQRILLFLKKEVKKWLRENIGKDDWCFDELSSTNIAFIVLEDAIAFKLRWL